MRQINTFQIGTAPGTIGRLQREISFPDGEQMTQVDCEAVVPITNTGSESVTLKQSDLEAIGAALFGNFRLSFGRVRPEIIDDSLTFAQLRSMFQYLTGRDFLINGVPLATFDTEVPAGIQINAGATVAVTIVLSRAFVFDRLGIERTRWCPGATQTRQMRIEVRRGADSLGAATGKPIAQAEAAEVTVLAHHVPEDGEDTWSPCIRRFFNAESGLESAGPSDAGLILGVFEESAPGDSTEIELFTLGRAGDAPVHDNVEAARVVRQGRYDLPIGAIDPNDLVTVLYQPPERVRIEDLPIGRGWYVRQAAQYVTPLKTVWIYVPEMTAERADDYAGPNAADEHRGSIKLSRIVADNKPARIAAVLPVAVIKAGSPAFALKPGVIYAAGGRAGTVDIPASIQEAASAAVAAAPTPDVRAASIAQTAQAISKFLPGGTSAARGAVARRESELVSSIASSVGAVDAARAATLMLQR